MSIKEWWDYLLSFTIYGQDNLNLFSFIFVSIFLIGGIIIFFNGFTKPFFPKKGTLHNSMSGYNGRKNPSGFSDFFGGLALMGFSIRPLFYITLLWAFFIFLLEFLKFLRKKFLG